MRSKNSNKTWTALSGGFTLVEIMLALGVLGIGMVLVAALFPPAIMQARQSDRNTLAMIINENAKEILSLRASMTPNHNIFTHSGAYSGLSAFEFAPIPVGNSSLGSNSGDMIHPDDVHYHPRGQDAGWRALVRRVDANRDGTVDPDVYQFVVIPYLIPPTMSNSDADTSDRLAHISDSESYKDVVSGATINTHNVRIRQTPLEGCLMLVDKSDYSGNLDRVTWLAIGSPVILDGKFNVDEPFLGRSASIVGVRDYEDDPGNVWAVQLSRDLFDSTHPAWDSNDEDGDGNFLNDIELERGVWVFATDAFSAPSPAMDCFVFTAVIK